MYIYIYIYIYIFNDNNDSNDNERSEFEIKHSMWSQISVTLVHLTWENFSVPLLPQVELGLTISARRLNALL